MMLHAPEHTTSSTFPAEALPTIDGAMLVLFSKRSTGHYSILSHPWVRRCQEVGIYA